MIDPERAAHCASCHAAIPPAEQIYTLRVDLFASAHPPEFDEADLLADHRAKWEALIESMESMTPHEVDDEADKVFERHEFTLCVHCRADLHERLKTRLR